MKEKKSMSIACLIYVILGLVLLFNPRETTKLFCTIVGALMLIYGGVTIVGFILHQNGAQGPSMAELILGVVSAVLGFFFVFRPYVILSILPTILGLYIVIDALVNLKRGMDMRALGYAGWTATLTRSIISLLLGGLILWNPFATQLMLIRVIGAAFLYQGISDLMSVLTLGKLSKSEDL